MASAPLGVFIRHFFLAAMCGMIALNSCTKSTGTKSTGTNNADTGWAIIWPGVDVTFTIPTSTDTSQTEYQARAAFSFDFDSLVSSETAGLMHLTNVDTFYVTSCTLTLDNPDSLNNFDTMSSIVMQLSTDFNNVPTTIADQENLPNDSISVLSLPVDPYFYVKTYLPAASSEPRPGVIYVCSLIRTPGSKFIHGGKTLTITAHVKYYIHASQ